MIKLRNQNLTLHMASLIKELNLPVVQRVGSNLPTHQVQYLLPRAMGKTTVSQPRSKRGVLWTSKL